LLGTSPNVALDKSFLKKGGSEPVKGKKTGKRDQVGERGNRRHPSTAQNTKIKKESQVGQFLDDDFRLLLKGEGKTADV